MAGDVVGIELAEALATLPDGFDRMLAASLLASAEIGAVAALIEKAEADKPPADAPKT